MWGHHSLDNHGVLLQHQGMAVNLIFKFPSQPVLAVVRVKQMRKFVFNVFKFRVLVHDMR